jgi:hypothetical protein
VAKIQSEVVIHPFIVGYGYANSLQKLIGFFRSKESDYQNWVFAPNMPPEARPKKRPQRSDQARTASEGGD